MARRTTPAPVKTAKKTTRSAPARRSGAKAAPKAASRAAAPKAAAEAAPGPIDPALVRDIAHLLAGTDLTEIEVSRGDLRIRVARETRLVAAAPLAQPLAAPAVVAAPAAAPVAPAAPSVNDAHILKSPMVGAAYRRPGPDARPFVEVGAQVKEGEKVLLVEAMKTFNEILAHRSGVVSAILVEDGQPVEYNQPLLVID